MLDRPCLRLRFVLVPCALLFLAGMAAGATAPSDLAEKGGSGSISGTVTAVATGAPISLIGVSLFRSNGADAGGELTEHDGSYSFEGLAPGIYFVRTNDFALQSYADQLYDHIPCPPGCDPTAGTPISVNANETTTGIDFELSLFGIFSGMITDSMTGEPVGGIEIVAWDEQGNEVDSTRTGVEGTYQFFPLPSGTYFLSTNSRSFDLGSYLYSDELYDDIACPGGAPGGCDPTAGTPVQLDVETSPRVDFALVRNGWISGRITEEVTGLPLTGIEVAAFDENGAFVTEAGTDAEGRYVLRAFFPGTYLVRALGVFGSRPSSYVYELYDDVPCPLPPESCDLSLGTPIPVAAAATTPGIDFTLLSTGNITGTVIDASTEQPPSYYGVEVFNASGERVFFQEFTEPDYAVTGLAPGTYYVKVDASSYFSELYDDIRCSDEVGCDPTTGTPITIGFAETAAGIDFALTPRFDGCAPSEHTLCLNNGRFRVNLNWSDFEQEGGAGFGEQLTDDSGYFYFLDSQNVEVVVKVLRACFGATPRYWVFAGGLTNLQTELIVTDTVTGQRHRYPNPLGTAFELIRDTETFTSCEAGLTAGEAAGDAVAAGQADASFNALLAGLASPHAVPQPAVSSEKGLCFFGPTSLCLTDNRFEVTATWTAGSTPPTPAAAEPLTTDTGYFTFLDPDNVEVVIKVLDACGLDPFHNFWVFAAGLTDLEVVLRVRDTDSGEEQVYTNALGDAFVPVQDTTHFVTCP